ncbi:hypothetical protein H5P28_05305 [Ruficoccus amylovorans]|uniref:O-Glycosyl hydrolase n=1 Tax=Ruficoccus amylovorans TaxID=1804625 RepID=A0A842HB96_9BACT|nr:glycoside hydrolase [Ruficoccus amylovorans]MBC2593675.1 hypothetical protein [Ruficoccus amylovorans]
MKLRIVSISAWLIGLVLGSNAHSEAINVTVDFGQRLQMIDNIGSSTGMHGDYIAREWDQSVVDQIADLLFSQELDDKGQPKGIGLSSFRMQIGAGASGDESGISRVWRRTDCFLRPDGSYDWEGQGIGTTYWRRKCEEYGIATTIGYLNSPPVYFTENGYSFKTEETFTSNLKPEHYGDYASFLAEVAAYYQRIGLPFEYISPVNEPQHSWLDVPGKAKQEGTPWTNSQIAQLLRLTDKVYQDKGVSTRLLIPESASYDALVKYREGKESAAASDQLAAFWDKDSPDYVGNLAAVSKIVAGHAYFSDQSVNAIVRTRRDLRTAIEDCKDSLILWQTEYSLLGDRYSAEVPRDSVDEMRAALLLARVIHADFTIAEASAWQWWSSTEPDMFRVPRFALIVSSRDGEESFRATKLLWALGQYSRFVRPGMQRIGVSSEESVNEQLQTVMASAFYDEKLGELVMVLINFSEEKQDVNLNVKGRPATSGATTVAGYRTTATENMAPVKIDSGTIKMPAKSIITIVSSPTLSSQMVRNN